MDGFDVGVDESFIDLIPDINMFAMLRFEARKAKWGLIADGFYVDLGTSATPPGNLYNSANLGLKQLLGELSIAYRVYESPSGFVDLYAGARYNGFKIDLGGSLNQPGIQNTSDSTSAKIVNTSEARAEAIAAPVAASYQAVGAAERAVIEADLAAAIQADVDEQVKDVEKRVTRLPVTTGSGSVTSRVAISPATSNSFGTNSPPPPPNLKSRSCAQPSMRPHKPTSPRRKQGFRNPRRISPKPSTANSTRCPPASLPTWTGLVDPIVGFRAQWNINEKWYLAGKSDIGGFGVGSELAWTLQATVGYNINESSSVELGYRYLHTDYDDDSVLYDVAEAGLYMSYNFRF